MSRSDDLAKADPFKRRSVTPVDLTDAMLPQRSPGAISNVLPANVEGATANADGTLTYGQFTFTPVGLRVQPGITVADWHQLGAFLKQATRAMQWWIGDWINSAGSQWGDMYQEAVKLIGMKESRLKNIAHVARSVDMSCRHDQLTFTHHEYVAKLSPDQQRAWLAKAAEGRWSAGRLRRELGVPDTEESEQTSELFSRAHRRKFERVWKNLQARKPDRISRQDIAELRTWLDNLDAALAAYGEPPKEDGDADQV